MKTKRFEMSQAQVDESDVAAVLEVMRSGRLSQGPYLDAFERGFAEHLGSRKAVGVSSGTAALMVALRAAGVRPGDDVITVSLSFVATANAIVNVGANPVFVDVCQHDLNMNPRAISNAVTPNTRAIVVVHLFGQMAEMKEICSVAQEFGLPVIEDACEALGARSGDGFAGTVGKAGVFGFYPNKPLTTAEGGMVVSDDVAFIEVCKSLRNQGRSDADETMADTTGYSVRLSELHAALGSTQLVRLDTNLDRRRQVAGWYQDRLAGAEGLQLPEPDGEARRHSWFTYPVRLPLGLGAHRDDIRDQLAADGVETRDYFTPIHLLPYYRNMLAKLPGNDLRANPSLPVTESEARRLVALPLYGELNAAQVRIIADTLMETIERYR